MATQLTIPTDPDAKIPLSVKAAAARAEEIHKTIYTKPEITPEPAAPASDNQPPVEQPQERPLTAEPAPQETPAVTQEGNQPAPASDEQSWEHKYKSMKGRWEAERDRSRSLAERIAHLEAFASSLQSAPAPTAPAPRQAERLITPEEETEYGSEFLGVVGKKAKEEFLPEFTALQQELAELKGQLQSVNQTSVVNARQRMFETLDQRLGNWREINNNDQFIDWLQLPDAYSGAIRHNLLKAAYEQNDTPRVMAFFQGFLAEEAAVDPAPAPGPDPTPRQTAPKIPLETLAAPGRAKTAATTPAEKPFFTRAQIASFYADVRANKYRGREAEKDQLERQIIQATTEGRIS